MQTLSNRFEAELRKRLDLLIAEFSDGLASGGAQSFEEYRYRAGKIAGLREAIGLCDEVQSDLAKR